MPFSCCLSVQVTTECELCKLKEKKMDKLETLVRLTTEGRITRRDFLIRAMALGLTAGVASNFLAACAPKATPVPAAKKITIGFTNLLKSNPFCATVEESCGKQCTKEGWGFYALDNDLNADKALANADAMVTKKVDLVWSFQALESLGPIIYQKYADAKIPCITIDAGMYKTVRFGADNWKAGVIAGEWMAEYAKKNWAGKVDGVVMTWVASWSGVVLGRIDGQVSAISKAFPEWNDSTISKIDTTLDPAGAEGAMRAWLNAHPNAHNVLASALTNDAEALAFLAAAQAVGREKDIAIVGGGGDQTAIAELKKPDNAFKGSVAFFPDRYGEFLAPITKNMLAGKPVDPDNFMGHLVLTRENVKQYYPG
jgi:ribose transport system substrate-binding protein